jgi:hypothetical protein
VVIATEVMRVVIATEVMRVGRDDAADTAKHAMVGEVVVLVVLVMAVVVLARQLCATNP